MMEQVFKGSFKTVSDPTGLGKHKDGPLIYQYVAARNWWKY